MEGDMHRWEVTLARWSASRGFPTYGRDFTHTPHVAPLQLESAAVALTLTRDHASACNHTLGPQRSWNRPIRGLVRSE